MWLSFDKAPYFKILTLGKQTIEVEQKDIKYIIFEEESDKSW